MLRMLMMNKNATTKIFKILMFTFIYIFCLCREKMAQSYDFALDKIGMDVQSFSIWNDYSTFLKSVDAVGSYAENQRISAVRKVRKLLHHFIEASVIVKEIR